VPFEQKLVNNLREVFRALSKDLKYFEEFDGLEFLLLAMIFEMNSTLSYCLPFSPPECPIL